MKQGRKGKVEQSETATTLSPQVEELILEHRGWAESIARSVARSWNMDFQLEGLDGAAMEALIFCARRFDPARGVPFRGYARRRIHEASTSEARESKMWKTGVNTQTRDNLAAREISAQLLDIFPDLRSGELPMFDTGDSSDEHLRGAIRTLLVSASILASRQGIDGGLPDDKLEYKRMVEMIATLEPIHQAILWKVYWEGLSLRRVADEWETDELNVMREHKVLVDHLHKCLSKGRRLPAPKVRPGLRKIALQMKRDSTLGSFSEIIKRGMES